MSSADVEHYFAEVGEWMKTDIKREIELARVSSTPDGRAALSGLGIPRGGGNLLAALGLVAYTEALGRVRLWNAPERQGYPGEEDSFASFFDAMAGGAYRDWWATWKPSRGKSAYHVLRSGLVHEYQPKVDAEIHIGTPVGLGLADKDGVLILRVEAYYEDFRAELDVLKNQLLGIVGREPEIPAAYGMPRILDSAVRNGGGSVASGPAGPLPFTSVRPTSGQGDDKVR